MSNRLRTLGGTIRWSRSVAALAANPGMEFVWCGNIKPAAYPARWVKSRLGIPYGILLHGGDLLILRSQARRLPYKRRTARALLGSAAVLVANSSWSAALCRELLDELGLQSERYRIERVPLGSDPRVFRPGQPQEGLLQRYGLERRRWLLSVARLTAHKGIDIGIKVLAALAQDYPDLGYLVVGSGEDLPALEKLAFDLGVADRVRFLTNVPDHDLPGLYNSAEVYLGLSRLLNERVEGFGISLVEASACGLPVLAGRAGGIPDAVRDGETGLLVDSETPETVVPALRRLLDDQALRLRLGKSARQAVETYYNWDRVAAEIGRIGRECSVSCAGVRPPSLRGAR